MIAHITQKFNLISESFRHIIILSTGYAIAIMSTMLMYTVLPVLLSEQRGSGIAGIGMMSITALQIFLFGPIAAFLADKHGARTMLFGYALCFGLGGILRVLYSCVEYSSLLSPLLMILMSLCFAAGYGCKLVDAYVLRTAPLKDGGIAFGRLVTFAGLGRLLGTLIQPHVIHGGSLRAAVIMIAAMILFGYILSKVPNDKVSPTHHDQAIHSKLDSILHFGRYLHKGMTHGWHFIKRCHYMPLLPLSVALWEGVFFGSLWFIVPLMLAHSTVYQSSGREIGIYEAISVLTAVSCGILADRRKALVLHKGGWFLLIVGLGWLRYVPSLTTLIWAGILIGIANNILYASGQHVLEQYDSDHQDDAAYTQLRQLVLNIGFMCMPIVRSFLDGYSNASLIQIHSAITGTIAILSGGVSCILIYRRYQHTKEQKVT